MKKIFCLLAMVILASAFTLPADDPFVTNVLRNLLTRVKSQPHEKVYLQTDRDHYAAGEKIWFRAYLLDAVTHKPSEYSRYVYVDLVDRMDSVRLRVKIRQTDSIYAGYLPLPKEMKQGEYFVRAYSYWMQNAGEDFIFKKKIRLVNVQDSKVQTQIKYAANGEQIEIYFTNSRKDVYDKIFVEYESGGKYKIGRTDEKGVLRLSAKELGEDRNIIVRFRAAEPFEFERLLTIPKPDRDFDLQFFPEGGNLLAGNMQTVAFKAIGTDGFGKDIEGMIYNEKDEFVAAIKSMHKGMGGFDFKPEADRRYHAVVTSSDNVKKTVELPVPKRDGLALKVWQRDSTLTYSILAGDSTDISENLYLAVLSRGVPLLCSPLTRTVGKLPLNVLPEGVVQLVLLNNKSEIYSQRMCFIRKKERPELNIGTDKNTYVVRDRVGVSVDIAAAAGQELSGSFSVSVTDDVQNEQDSVSQNNILSYLLLTSDLKGYIEDPAFYFNKVDRGTERLLDLLMMTQGWTRFNLPEAIRGELPELPYYLEQGQAISGYVKNFWGKNALDAKLMVFSTNRIIETVMADSSGYFMLDGISFPDSTKFFVQALSKKGRRSVELLVDKEQFLKPRIEYPYNVESIEEEDDFYKKFVKDYYYENGIKVYVLDEAVVTGKKAPKIYSTYDFAATYGVDSAKLAAMSDLDMRQVFETIPGIRVDEVEKTVSRLSRSLVFLVNDIQEDYDYVMTLRPADLLNISYVDGSQAGVLIGDYAANGALVLTTNPNYVNTKQRLNISVLSFLGYQKPSEFYIPKYEVDSVRRALAKVADERSTIYWNPDVRTNAAGKAEFSFFTSDSYGPYTVIIEGVLDDGTVCRKERKITLKLPGL